MAMRHHMPALLQSTSPPIRQFAAYPACGREAKDVGKAYVLIIITIINQINQIERSGWGSSVPYKNSKVNQADGKPIESRGKEDGKRICRKTLRFGNA
jgi:hypothetical protein